MQYHVDGGRPSISVITLRNKSNEAGVELIFSEALRREILGRGALSLVRDPSEARFVVRGTMEALKTSRRSFNGVTQAREYQVTMRLALSIEDLLHASPAPRYRIFEASEIYLASADVEAGRKNRREALVYLSGLLASQVHDMLDREQIATSHANVDTRMPAAIRHSSSTSSMASAEGTR